MFAKMDWCSYRKVLAKLGLYVRLCLLKIDGWLTLQDRTIGRNETLADLVNYMKCSMDVLGDRTGLSKLARLSEDRSSSITNIIMKKIMPATVSTVTALAKLLWRNSDSQQASDYRPPEVKPQEFGRASLITSLKDRPRKGERIALSPSGAMAAITDSLGRILLVDTQALVVIRLWKGYRDASCFFLEVPVDRGALSSSSRPSNKGMRKQDLVLCLAIHAPRREVVEIWKLRDGPRVSIVKCESGCRVIQPACHFRGSDYDMEEEYIPAEAYILNGDSGQLTVLSPQL
ncbi:hypothetical protein L7F22_041506 [Adiantum nelumboides]|nr:hypothetical protein [Adiantum nelumboides]